MTNDPKHLVLYIKNKRRKNNNYVVTSNSKNNKSAVYPNVNIYLICRVMLK